MSTNPSFEALSPLISSALEGRGFTTLTAIQQAVLDPAYVGRDLRLFSQTGSGKTVAVGLVLAADLERIAKERAGSVTKGTATPAVILIAPTRELATQLAGELTWLFEPLGVTVASVTGGTSYMQEVREFKKGPLVVVGTPGRLLDHLTRGSINPAMLITAVLDEADQMLDMGFRDELEGILATFPADRRTHLVAATFSREVRTLADRYQKNAVAIEGTTLGVANVDIAHIAHLVRADDRAAAIINILLLEPDERALIFVRTREGTATLADTLSDAGFRALSISGDLEQRERTRTLDAFRSGSIRVLVATDVAARGLDIADVNRVIHADPPNDAETFTHRSGRTGRAGRKGVNIVLVTPNARERVLGLLRQARVTASWLPVPQPEDVIREADSRLRDEFIAQSSAPIEPRLKGLATSLLKDVEPVTMVATLLAHIKRNGPSEPRHVTQLSPLGKVIPGERTRRDEPLAPPRSASPSASPSASARPTRDNSAPRSYPPARAADVEAPAPRGSWPPPPREKLTVPRGSTPGPQSFALFRVTWGSRHGADPRRLLALVCRRGDISSNQVGAIQIGDTSSTVQIASHVVPGFTEAAQRPDERDPRIQIDPIDGGSADARPSYRPPTPSYRPPSPSYPPRPAPRPSSPYTGATKKPYVEERAPTHKAPHKPNPKEPYKEPYKAPYKEPYKPTFDTAKKGKPVYASGPKKPYAPKPVTPPAAAAASEAPKKKKKPKKPAE